jgi:tetratricopeptide (TPR) repeat protein
VAHRSTPGLAIRDLHQQAASLFSAGKFADALSLVQPLVETDADVDQGALAETLHLAALCLLSLRRLADAEIRWRRSITVKPDFRAAYSCLGVLLKTLKRLPEAEAIYRAWLIVRPDDAEALNNLGAVLYDLGRKADAEAAYGQALTIRPGYFEARYNLGMVLQDLGRLHDALSAYRSALAIRPDHAKTCWNLGRVLSSLKRWPEAEVAYRQAISNQPDFAEAHYNLGTVLYALDRLSDACKAFQQALALCPGLPDIHATLAGVLVQLDRLQEAETSYRAALALRADHHEARFGLAVVLLSTGRFEEGWPLYESRYEQPGFVHSKMRSLLRCPQWQGEPLGGKSLLVWQEDGLGDTIQFSRYLPLLKAQGAAHIAFACAPSLHRLFATVDGVDTILDHDAALERSSAYDCWASLLSAPCHLHTTVDTIPAPVHLEPEISCVERWRARLETLPAGPKIGLVWKGNPRHHNDAHRSLPSLATLAPLWSVPGLNFISLQKGPAEDDARSAPVDRPLLHLGSDVTDFADSAAIVHQLDLVICVDTSIAHLTASLGKPCWVLLPGRDIDWRWLREQTGSPWYPNTVRLFRQTWGEPWSSIVDRVRQACVEHFSVASG